jgi:hypothetical protein
MALWAVAPPRAVRMPATRAGSRRATSDGPTSSITRMYGCSGSLGVSIPTQLRQHAPADVAQIGGALGEQRVLQRFLLFGRRFDHRHPRRFGAFALLEAGVDFIGQFRVVEHFLVGDENLADRLGFAALDQALMSCAPRPALV